MNTPTVLRVRNVINCEIYIFWNLTFIYLGENVDILLKSLDSIKCALSPLVIILQQ